MPQDKGFYFKNEIRKNSVLIGAEGNDEVWAISALGSLLEIPQEKLHVTNYSQNSRSGVRIEQNWIDLNEDEFRNHPLIAIICDAEDSAQETYQKWCDLFEAYGLPKPPQDGTIGLNTDPDLPATAIFIAPKGHITEDNFNGCLEFMFLNACNDQSAKSCAEDFLTCCGSPPQKQGLALDRWKAKFLCQNIPKSSLKPGLTFGQSLMSSSSQDLWNLDAPSLEPLKAFLQNLANFISE